MKKILFLGVTLIIAHIASAATITRFHHQNTPTLQNIIRQSDTANALVKKGNSQFDKLTGISHQRLQQTYLGVPIIGCDMTVHQQGRQSWANGQLATGIALTAETISDLQTAKSKKDFLQKAMRKYKKMHPHTRLYHGNIQLAILITKWADRPIYQIQFDARTKEQSNQQVHQYIDALNPDLIYKEWDNTPHFTEYDDIGAGGNYMNGLYYYGEGGIPPIRVRMDGNKCTLENEHVRLVNLFKHPEQDDFGKNHYRKAYTYSCGSVYKDDAPLRGAFSPADDVYFFGNLVVAMYQDWYQTTVLPFQLVLRIHHRNDANNMIDSYENAFWDETTKTMNFGDGIPGQSYPLIAPEIIGHEVSHGFTNEHANLAYHDQSGALNESFSDMAGMATNAYLLEYYPALYKAQYGTDKIQWTIGGNVILSHPFRYFDSPSKDGQSPDCFEKADNISCTITYDEMIEKLKSIVEYLHMPELPQGFIVHRASGIFNRAFYILATKPDWSIRKAFAVMMTANRDGYWTSGGLEQEDFFNDAACGVIDAARDLKYNTDDVADALHQVGLLLHRDCNKPVVNSSEQQELFHRT